MWRTAFLSNGRRVATCNHARQGCIGHVGNLQVERGFRNQGVGRVVMGILEENARRANCTQLRLTAYQKAFSHNVEFFERVGFVCCRLKGRCAVVDDGVELWDVVPMVKRLEPIDPSTTPFLSFPVDDAIVLSDAIRQQFYRPLP